jgi:hypothetical protein
MNVGIIGGVAINILIKMNFDSIFLIGLTLPICDNISFGTGI